MPARPPVAPRCSSRLRSRTPMRSSRGTAGGSRCSPTASYGSNGHRTERSRTGRRRWRLHRDLPVPQFTVRDAEGGLEIVTERFRLTYDRGPFSPSGLSLQVRGNVSTYHSVWRYGEPIDDLRGTARTLDGIDGRLPLGPGVVSRWGYAMLDDSASMVFTDDGWVDVREPGRIDLYVFAYGLDHTAALEAFAALSGRPPLLPRWTLGNWWSRYHAYSDAEYLALMDRFAAEDLPFSVAVIDMDWHRVGDVEPVYGSGWTGYSWNRTLFPDPEGFLAEPAPPRPPGHAERASGRRRAGVRGRLPGDVRGARSRPGQPGADPVRPHRPPVPRRLLRGAEQGTGGPGRRLLLDRLAVGSVLAARRRRSAVDAQPLPLPGLRPGRPATADVLPLRRTRQPPLPGRASPATR